MADRDFTISIPESILDDYKLGGENRATKPFARDLIFFPFDTEPNVEEGDTISVRVLIDDDTHVVFKAVVDTKVPPLEHPASTESFKVHEPVLRKYFNDATVEKIRSEYFKGSGYKDSWTIFFKKVDE